MERTCCNEATLCLTLAWFDICCSWFVKHYPPWVFPLAPLPFVVLFFPIRQEKQTVESISTWQLFLLHQPHGSCLPSTILISLQRTLCNSQCSMPYRFLPLSMPNRDVVLCCISHILCISITIGLERPNERLTNGQRRSTLVRLITSMCNWILHLALESY